ncbi:hypothetical protein EI94DRAFT_1031243 [Lactarius quietus]|nr:hypothetical protein EI94DRAFT_1031243 [Lactarius quietus]
MPPSEAGLSNFVFAIYVTLGSERRQPYSTLAQPVGLSIALFAFLVPGLYTSSCQHSISPRSLTSHLSSSRLIRRCSIAMLLVCRTGTMGLELAFVAHHCLFVLDFVFIRHWFPGGWS